MSFARAVADPIIFIHEVQLVENAAPEVFFTTTSPARHFLSRSVE